MFDDDDVFSGDFESLVRPVFERIVSKYATENSGKVSFTKNLSITFSGKRNVGSNIFNELIPFGFEFRFIKTGQTVFFEGGPSGNHIEVIFMQPAHDFDIDYAVGSVCDAFNRWDVDEILGQDPPEQYDDPEWF